MQVLEQIHLMSLYVRLYTEQILSKIKEQQVFFC